MLERLALPPGVGVMVFAGAVPDVLPLGVKRDTEIEDPVYVIVTRDGAMLCTVVVPRRDFGSVDELISPVLDGGADGPPGPKLVR